MSLTHEQVRSVLEENYTHVTFVKSLNHATLWTVGDDMRRVIVENALKPDEILADIVTTEVQRVKRRINGDKLHAFYNAMICGAIPYDAKLYDRYTTKQLNELRKVGRK